MVVLDLDRLKEINDTYGHEAGDRALRAVGDRLRSTVRQNDLCARFAGDEFIVVLWDCSPEHEERRVLELQTAVGAHPFEPRPGVRVSLSISAGAARFPVDGDARSTSCWPPPTSGCTTTRPAAARAIPAGKRSSWRRTTAPRT